MFDPRNSPRNSSAPPFSCSSRWGGHRELRLQTVRGQHGRGVVTTALAFGLVLMALAYAIGPISGAQVNPAVTLGFVPPVA